MQELNLSRITLKQEQVLEISLREKGLGCLKKIIIASDSFKESLDAFQVADAIAHGIRKVMKDAEIIKIPMSDGGEGLVRTLVTSTGGELRQSEVTGPLGEKVQATWGVLGNGETCVLEMAAASGLPLVQPNRRNPKYTTTWGTGELIKCALNSGCKKIIVGIGGSATNDGGAGMAQALGANLRDVNGREIAFGAEALNELYTVNKDGLDSRLQEVEIIVAVDVDNPLCGPRGASYVYGPQKGATPEMLPELDEILEKYAAILKRDLGIDVLSLPGSGAAGGLGAGMAAFLNATMKPGIEVMMDAVQLENHMQKDVDLVITGEGGINSQTAAGKVPVGVARRAKKYNLPVIALVGSIGEGAEEVHEHGVDAFFSLTPGPVTLADAMENAGEYLTRLAEQCIRIILATKKTQSK